MKKDDGWGGGTNLRAYSLVGLPEYPGQCGVISLHLLVLASSSSRFFYSFFHSSFFLII